MAEAWKHCKEKYFLVSYLNMLQLMSLSEVKKTFYAMQAADFEMLDCICCNTTLSIKTQYDVNASILNIDVVIVRVS